MVTLDRLINVLGGYGVRLLTPAHGSCPAPRSTELRSVVMHEPGRVVGDVLLAVGADSIAEAVQWAEAARAVVVLVRGPHSPADGEDLTAGVGVAVMTVEPEVSWSELAAVVYGVVLEGRETESGRGPTDLFALADSLADAVGGAVTIEDRRSAVLAYSRLQQHADPARAETILSRGAPERLRALFESRGVFRHLTESDEPMFVEGDDDRGLTGRMVVAARAGRELLGSIWVTCAAPLRRAPGRARRRRPHGGPASAAFPRQRGSGTSGGIGVGHPSPRRGRGRHHGGQSSRAAADAATGDRVAGPHRR